QIGQPIRLLQELEPLVALLEEALEVRPLRRQRGVLEHGRKVPAHGGAGAAGAAGKLALLERGRLEAVLGGRTRALVGEGGPGSLLRLLLLGARREVGQPPRGYRDRRG